MKTKILVAAVLLFLLPAIARADAITFNIPNFQFSASAGQRVDGSFDSKCSIRPSGISCEDLNYGLVVTAPSGLTVLTGSTHFDSALAILNGSFVAPESGVYNLALTTIGGPLFNGTAGMTWTGTINISDPATPTPEPATLMLFGTGLAGVAARFYRRRKKV
jgi:PEP-CTERM motif